MIPQPSRKLMCFLTLAPLALMWGCAARSPFERWAQTPPSSSLWRSNARPLSTGAAAINAPATEHNRVVLPKDAGVEDYVRVALKRNPAITATRQQIAAAFARVPQVTSLDDPMLTVSPVGEMAQTAAGEVGVMTGVSQKLPFPGKLDTRGKIALEQARAKGAMLAKARLRVIADTRQAYWSYYDAARAIDVIRQSRSLLNQLKSAAQAAYAAGAVPQQDVLRAMLELGELKKKLLTLDQSRAAATARLNALMDRPADAPLPSPRPMRGETPVPPASASPKLTLDHLIQLAKQTNPDLARIHHRIAAAHQQLKLARLNYWPDLTVGLHYNFVQDEGLVRNPNGDDQWWLSFGVNVPLWQGKREAAESEALRRLFAATADLKQALDEQSATLRDLLTRFQTQRQLIALFRDTLIPQAKQAVDASLAAYRAGNADFLDVVDNWRKLLNYQQLYYHSIAARAQALAAVEEVVGQDVGSKPQPDLEQ